VAELSLEEFQRNQARQISQEVIGQCEEREQKMQASWQKLWETAHQYLVALLRLLDQDYDESCEKSVHPLEKFNDDDLYYLVQVRIRTLKGHLASQEKQNINPELQIQLEGISEKYRQLIQDYSFFQSENKKLLYENAGLKAHLAVLHQAQKDAFIQTNRLARPSDEIVTVSNPDTLPNWMETWRSSKTFERTSTAILVMGETGMALRPSITKTMARKLLLSEDNHSLDEAVTRLIDPGDSIIQSDSSLEDQSSGSRTIPDDDEVNLGLIEAVEGVARLGSSSGGNYPDVLRLTPKGMLAYRLITGKDPKENEFDRLIRFHSTPEHTILNIQAAEMLVEGGYQIQGQVQEIRLSNGGTFIPDIIAADRKTGEIIFVEVERDVHKDQSTRKQKWINLYEASNGNFYIFCDNLSCQRVIQGEINLALGGLTFNSYLTNLHGLRSGKRAEKDGSLWLSKKQGK
jgi:hypothetical protein